MKRRQPLKRKTPLAKGQQRSWNSTLRPMSARKRQQKHETDGQRRDYVASARGCERCQARPATDCHEIPAGAHRDKAIKLPNT